MTLKEKGILWKLTFPFAHANYTTIGDKLYYPKGNKPSAAIIAHETIHSKQMKKEGLTSFMFKYLFCLPMFYNSFRFKSEYEAYTKGSKISRKETVRKLRSYKYGFLLND